MSKCPSLRLPTELASISGLTSETASRRQRCWLLDHAYVSTQACGVQDLVEMRYS